MNAKTSNFHKMYSGQHVKIIKTIIMGDDYYVLKGAVTGTVFAASQDKSEIEKLASSKGAVIVQ